MKTLHLSIIAIFLGFVGLMLLHDYSVYGLWVPQSPRELLDESSTIFVGNITSVNILQFEKGTTYNMEENGTEKNVVKNYTLSLDEYKVDVEEFLKNTQMTNKMTVRQPALSLSPGMLGGLDEFHVGDRVLFYVKSLDGNNTYSPESFIIPKSCTAKDVLTQKRLEARGESFTIQNGIKVDNNFTANKPIQFVNNQDANTLSGKSIDTVVHITRNTGSSPEVVFSKEIHSQAKPCEWIASTEWEFTPQEGEYRMDVTITEDNKTYSQYVAKFSVKSDVISPDHMSPLKQFKSGIAANDVKCVQGFQLVIKSEDNSPACVKLQTAQKLVERGWGWAMQPIDSLKPLLPNRIAGLENDTGIVTFGNRTYYFETPHYTQDAYVNPVHISFHDVVFTLFPPGFKGGLPTNFGGVAANGCSGSYFWTDAKFVDGTHAFLNIFALTTMSQQCLALPAPTYFSINTDPLAGLTFYDGKMKLLVSVEGKLQQNNPVFSATIPTNETIYHDFPQPRGYSIINSTQGIIVNTDAEASNLTGFSVKPPTYLPQGYKVKLIKASKEIPMVTIFVSKYPLTDNITSHDFLWNQQGILITYQQVAPHELEHFNQLFYGPEDKIIRINGALAVISDISKQYYHGYPYDMWGSLLAIQNNDTNIAIDGFLNSDDFIKIATSMLEK